MRTAAIDYANKMLRAGYNTTEISDNSWEIIRYGQQEKITEQGGILIFSPAGNSKLFPSVYHLYNDTAQYCKNCFEELRIWEKEKGNLD